jgi:ribosomal protein L11 methyltransferase
MTECKSDAKSGTANFRHGVLVRLKVHVPDELRDALSSALFDAGAAGLEEEPGALCVYATEAKLLEVFKHAVTQFSQSQGADLGRAIWIEHQEVSSSWNQTWQQALRAESLTQRLVLRPTHDKPAPIGEETLWFEPHASFGAGEHPTTQLAAQFIEEFVNLHKPLSMLDVGCGSGVLSLVAALRGTSMVLAVDIDEIAVSSTRENLKLNGLEKRVTVEKGSADLTSDTFDLVVANINTPILLDLCDSITARTASGGTLILTGLLEEDEDAVITPYTQTGLALQTKVQRAGWTLLEFVAPKLT